MLVSIIIPAYKSEKFICTCLDSVLSQTYEYFEVIVVVNGGGLDLLKVYMERDSRITVVYFEERLEPGKARNVGIDLAKGDYFCFVDADDTIEPEYIETLLNGCLDNNVALTVCNHSINQKDSELRILTTQYKNITHQSGEKRHASEIFKEPFCPEDKCGAFTYGETAHVWAKIFNADIIRNNNLRFCEDVTQREDQIFMFAYAAHIDFILVINDILYKYSVFSVDAHRSTTEMNDSARYETAYKACMRKCDIIDSSTLDKILKRYCYRVYCANIIASTFRIVRSNSLKGVDVVRKLREYCNNYEFRSGVEFYLETKLPPGYSKLLPKLLKYRLWCMAYSFVKLIIYINKL